MILRSRWINAIDGIAAAVFVQVDPAVKSDGVLRYPSCVHRVVESQAAAVQVQTRLSYVADLCIIVSRERTHQPL